MDLINIIQKDQEVWDLFTRKVEYNSQIRDQYDRFPYWASGYQNIFEPLVSKYLIEQGYTFEYPGGKPFAVCLTHDIDTLYKTKAGKILAALLHFHDGHFSEGLHSLAEMRSKKLPLWNFSDITELEERYGAKSSFYFMVQEPKDPYNANDNYYPYEIEDCETIIGELSDGGWEVGLHGGHSAYIDPVEIREKKQRLEKVLHKTVIGYRNHYLRFRVPDTWEHLHNAGFRYDSTLGYADCIGFRNGMCHPFKPYNLTTQCEIDILEIPLTLMDNTLDQYMKLDASNAWEITKRLIDTVEQYHGVLTLVWHNTSFIGEQKKFYEKILKYCAEKGAWMTNGEEIYQFYSG